MGGRWEEAGVMVGGGDGGGVGGGGWGGGGAGVGGHRLVYVESSCIIRV